MANLFKLGWRNIWRNKRRSLITIAAISFAVLIMAATRSLQYGTYDTMESLAIRLFNGDIQVHRSGFQAEQTLNFAMQQDEQNWQKIVSEYPTFEGVSQRVSGFGLLSTDSASAGGLIVGIQPEKEGAVTQFVNMVREGERLMEGDDHLVVLGKTLAMNLQANIGDTVVVLTQGFRNQLGADTYVIKGLMSAGNPDVDRGLMLMPLHNAQDLFSLYDGVTQVVYRTEDFRKVDEYKKTLDAAWDNDELEILSWQEMMPELEQMILMDNVSGAIYLLFILLVVGFEIFNTTMMTVMERSKEFGVLEAIGMKPGQIVGLVLWESVIKISLSLVIGLAVSGAAIAYLIRNPIQLSQELQEAYAGFGFAIDALFFSGRPLVFLEPLVSIAIISFVAIVFPVYRTRKLTPIEALRKA
jgi:ABC-type lipoprotein release transport system permease subunit